MPEAKLLKDVLRARVREVRLQKGWTQEDFAMLARTQGLAWTRDTAKNLEDGSRDVSLDEFFCLLPLLGTGLEELFPSDMELELAGGWTVRGGAELRALLDGKRDARVRPAPIRLSAAGHVAATATVTRLADQKASKSLGVPVEKVQALAQQSWGRDLTAEREARVSERLLGQGDIPPRTLQALRGLVTRELLDELRPLKDKSRLREPKRKGRARG